MRQDGERGGRWDLGALKKQKHIFRTKEYVYLFSSGFFFSLLFWKNSLECPTFSLYPLSIIWFTGYLEVWMLGLNMSGRGSVCVCVYMSTWVIYRRRGSVWDKEPIGFPSFIFSLCRRSPSPAVPPVSRPAALMSAWVHQQPAEEKQQKQSVFI